jgi:hypothetical protein
LQLKEAFATEQIFNKIKSVIDQSDQTRVTLYHLSLETLSKLPLVEKQKILAQMKAVFDMDGKMSLLEGLLYINAISALAPGKLSTPPGNSETAINAVIAMTDKYENVDFSQLTAIVAKNKMVSLITKKQIVEQLLHHFVSDSRQMKEEFRLLCLAIGIPVPPW